MGCCQPAEFISYDYSSDNVLKSYHLSSSRIPYKNNYRTSLNVTPQNHHETSQNASLNNFKSPKRVIHPKDFQTPTQKKSKTSNWNSSEINFKNILAAYRNEDLEFLFEYVSNKQSFEKDWLLIEHKWASLPRNLGDLSCALISNILTSYLNEQINIDLLKEIENVLSRLLNNNKLNKIMEYLLEKQSEPEFDEREYEFLMLSMLLEFRISFHENFLNFRLFHYVYLILRSI